MSLRWKIVLLAILPLLVASVGVAFEVLRQARQLGEQQAALIEAILMEQKRDELRHAIALVAGELEVLRDEADGPRAAVRAKALIHAAHYGEDGYFFAYDPSGTCLVHPKQPELVGRNLWELKDSRGRSVIPGLVETAQRGSGFQEYEWNKPSTGRTTAKLAHVALLPRFGWVLGTGVYLDDVARASKQAREEARRSVSATMWRLAGVALLAIALVFAGTMVLNVNEQRLADGRLRLANERLVTLRDRERERVARELHEGVLQVLAAAKNHLALADQKLDDCPAEARQSLALGLDRLALGIADVRAIAHAHPPTPLGELGFSRAMSELAQDVALGAEFTVEYVEALGGSPPPEPYASMLYRAAQECMSNARRHAQAKHVELALRREASGDLTLRVSDDGKGFELAVVNDKLHTGLRHLRERVADLDGTFVVQSRPGRTVLSVHLKVNEAP